jgi:hypothetical protein
VSPLRPRLRLAAPILALALALVFGPGIASAGPKKIPVKTEVGVDTITGSTALLLGIGWVDAGKPACVANRTLVVELERQAGGLVPVDIARSSDNGGWLAAADSAVITPQGPFTNLRVKALKRRVRVSKSKLLICRPKTFEYPLTD